MAQRAWTDGPGPPESVQRLSAAADCASTPIAAAMQAATLTATAVGARRDNKRKCRMVQLQKCPGA
jgi:hypothetical protein